eukprot:tig00020572_g11538.t1
MRVCGARAPLRLTASVHLGQPTAARPGRPAALMVARPHPCSRNDRAGAGPPPLLPPSPAASSTLGGLDVALLDQITFRDDFLAPLPGRWATGIAAPDLTGELPTRNGCGAPRFSGRTSRPDPGHRRRAGPPDLRGPTATGTGKRSSFLGTAAATGVSARLPVRVLAWPIHTPSAASGAAAGEERGPGISPGEPSGPPRSSAPPLFPRMRMRGGR